MLRKLPKPKPTPLNNWLRAVWKGRGYSTTMGSAAVTHPPRDGYRRVYHISNSDHALGNIVFKRLKVARFQELNDPFELLAHDSLDKNVRQSLARHKLDLHQQRGLLCFSGDWTDPVLWSHYAANHRGICLGFDIEDHLAQEVLYQSTRLVGKIKKVGPRIDDDLSKLLLRTKFESWKYEKEWRIVVELSDCDEEGGMYFYGFNAGLRLVEVVLGSLCTYPIDQLRTLVNDHYKNCVTFQARLALKSFNIVPKESTVPYIAPPKRM